VYKHGCVHCKRRQIHSVSVISATSCDVAERRIISISVCIENKTYTPSQGKVTAYIATGSGSEMKAWLLSKGFDEADVGHILLQFIKPEYGVKTLMEMFALEDADIDEILQGLPLAKRRALKKHIQLGV